MIGKSYLSDSLQLCPEPLLPELGNLALDQKEENTNECTLPSLPEADDSNLSKREKRQFNKLAMKKMEAYRTFCKLEGFSDKPPFSRLPRKTLLLVNLGYGAVGGADATQIESIFSQFKGFEKVVMVHGKPYTFVEFRGGDDALIARNALHEKQCPELNSKVLFIEFVNHQDFAYLSDRVYHNIESKLASVSGLIYKEDFISISEEKDLLDNIAYNNIDNESQLWHTIQNRKIQHYKNSFDYRKKHVGSTELVSHHEIPDSIDLLIKRAQSLYPDALGSSIYDQVSVQQYPPGSGISFHADSHTAFGDCIFIVSLLNPIMMEFRHPASNSLVCLDLKPRSLAILSGDARFGWEHGIRARKSDNIDGNTRLRDYRWSITIRSINQNIFCDCKYPALCDNNTIYVRDIRKSKQL
ncbi:hypothetical protein BB560_006728 [Smittium megazygosporum]|uniref:Fe2OG dioxygenase domain-containing protein n=1 Tax=Smittium megazygosporum TaxID=133381 RepID=A0A2T9Y246_9FUNG|nr:hypothetical protein BB560_006728 [Smittium megazygosporum]